METELAEPAPLREKARDAQKAVNILQGRVASLNQTITMIVDPFSQNTDENTYGVKMEGVSPADYLTYVESAQKLRLDAETELACVNDDLLKARDNLQTALDEIERTDRGLREKNRTIPGMFSR
jgi:septation ring formation regulator EzrA